MRDPGPVGFRRANRANYGRVQYAREIVPTDEHRESRVETFRQDGDRLTRVLLRRDGNASETDMGPADQRVIDPARLQARADRLLLRAIRRPPALKAGARITIVDLFCGVGALSWGVLEAARALGIRAELVLAADSDPQALSVVEASLSPRRGVTRCLDLGEVLAGRSAQQCSAERAFLRDCPSQIDVLVAGPPCQGHSRLNNHTRHDDPRNDLYGCVARFAELRRPKLVIIENVDTITSDQRGSAAAARQRIAALQYSVSEATVQLHHLGVPQSRRRHLLVATRPDQPTLDVDAVIDTYGVPRSDLRTVRWAIADLATRDPTSTFDSTSAPNEDNQRRLQWFARHPHAANLPNTERPDCHRLPREMPDGSLKQHSYRSMYGRLDWDRPAQTITSGFGSMGQGRYVHPGQLRTLTPHEAARLQFIPDFFDFSSVRGRGHLARMIGNVAPMKLSYPFVIEFLR